MNVWDRSLTVSGNRHYNPGALPPKGMRIKKNELEPAPMIWVELFFFTVYAPADGLEPGSVRASLGPFGSYEEAVHRAKIHTTAAFYIAGTSFGIEKRFVKEYEA